MTKQQEQVVIAQQGEQFGIMHQRTASDAPMLPVEDIITLKEVCPDAIQLILEETRKEAEFRREAARSEQNKYYFQRIAGQVFAFLMGLAGIAGGVICVLKDHPGAGTTISSLAIATLALAFLGKRVKPQDRSGK